MRQFVLTLFLCLSGLAAADIAVRPVAISDNGVALLQCVAGDFGLQWTDVATSVSVPLVRDDFACYYATLSPDGQRAAYKDFVPTSGSVTDKIPCVYLRAADKVVRLCAPSPDAGNPAVGATDVVAWTVGTHLYAAHLSDSGELNVYYDKDLGFAANHCAISPNGTEIALTADDGRLVMLNPDTDSLVTLGAEEGIFAPRFSPDGTRLLMTNTRGDVLIAKTTSQKNAMAQKFTRIERESMGAPEAAWIDNNTLMYTQFTGNGEVTQRSERIAVDPDTLTTQSLQAENGDAVIVSNPRGIAVATEAEAIKKANKTLAGNRTITPQRVEETPAKMNGKITVGSDVYFTGLIPYFNQVYDSLNSFSGGYSCCGSVASIMAAQYYGKLPPQPQVVSTGGSHLSYWGFYISEIFTVGGKTFNAASSSAWGDTKAGYYGVFGWFLQDYSASSLDRSKRLAEFITACGLSSYCDDSVSGDTGITKARTEIDNEYPFVILNSITTSGHYTTCMGYVSAQHTLIFYDPYGNKNIDYPCKDGRLAYYDTPGYNNGYQNLNGVWRFIYARGSNPTNLTLSGSKNVLNAGQSLQLNAISSLNKGGSKIMNTTVTWGSSNIDVATVSATGLVQASSTLTADKKVNICVNFQNFTAVYPLTIRGNATVNDWQ